MRPEAAERLRRWFAQMQGERLPEVQSSFGREGMLHEKVLLVETSDGPLLVYAMEMEDEEHATAVFNASSEPVDVDHRAVLKECLDGVPDQQIIFDVRVT